MGKEEARPLANVDRRAGTNGAVASAEWAALQREVPGVTMERHRVTGTPKWVAAAGSFLTKEAAGKEGEAVVREFVNGRRELFGHDATVLDAAAKTRDDVTKHNGMRTLVWQQRYEGLAVFEGILKATVTRLGELVNIGSQVVPDALSVASFARFGFLEDAGVCGA